MLLNQDQDLLADLSIAICSSYRRIFQIEMTFTEFLKIFAQEFLLKFMPIVGFGRYDHWIQTKNNSGIFSITATHDQCLAAYSR